eukprot:CAMPEP_0178730606 /NCGR_PEP_ID=MMETSP0699-20121125/29610_1 /TAXON_ID=265572 /ORGANISM="Extubocellulus spinifer, Strain CCMP396" /LENGTH=184 /DNA_ID=CAMNT_0020382645 /DNA_START=53 /DNA_END=603 /DNA_ORIENTATION=+
MNSPLSALSPSRLVIPSCAFRLVSLVIGLLLCSCSCSSFPHRQAASAFLLPSPPRTATLRRRRHHGDGTTGRSRPLAEGIVLFSDRSAVIEPEPAVPIPGQASDDASNAAPSATSVHSEEDSDVNDDDSIRTQSAFSALSNYVSNCIIQSDIKRIKGLDGASTGWTSWVDDESAFRLQRCIDAL